MSSEDEFLEANRRLDKLGAIYKPDSHPDTSDLDEEAAKTHSCIDIGDGEYDFDLMKHDSFLKGCAHARKSQAAEVARMRELLERASKIIEDEAPKKLQWLSDYAALKKELG